LTRRRLLAAGLVVATASAGLGWALRRRSEGPPFDSDDVQPPRPVDVWSLHFEKPGGGTVTLGTFRGQPLVLNFWATWCPPCVEEMPMLDRFQREQRASGWRVLGLAVDNAAPVRDFLARHPVDFAIGLAGMEGVALSRSLGNTSGALPFSVIFDARGEAVERKLGVVNWDELTTWAGRIG
jgi:thiol-disulfide isomerase/thioredoxin